MMSLTRSIAIVELVCCTRQRGRRPGCRCVRRAGLAVHEVLADERLRPDLAVRVLAQVREPGLGDLGLHDRERAARLDRHDLECLGLAGPDAGDLEVAALGEPEGVVEAADLVGLAAAVVARLGAERQRRRPHAGSTTASAATTRRITGPPTAGWGHSRAPPPRIAREDVAAVGGGLLVGARAAAGTAWSSAQAP